MKTRNVGEKVTPVLFFIRKNSGQMSTNRITKSGNEKWNFIFLRDLLFHDHRKQKQTRVLLLSKHLQYKRGEKNAYGTWKQTYNLKIKKLARGWQFAYSNYGHETADRGLWWRMVVCEQGDDVAGARGNIHLIWLSASVPIREMSRPNGLDRLFGDANVKGRLLLKSL